MLADGSEKQYMSAFTQKIEKILSLEELPLHNR